MSCRRVIRQEGPDLRFARDGRHSPVAARRKRRRRIGVARGLFERIAGQVAGKEGAGEGVARARIPGFRVEAVDATGAGDTFAGAFLARHLAGDTLEQAARYANAAAALSTRGYGAVAPIPREAEVRAFLADQPPA